MNSKIRLIAAAVTAFSLYGVANAQVTSFAAYNYLETDTAAYGGTSNDCLGVIQCADSPNPTTVFPNTDSPDLVSLPSSVTIPPHRTNYAFVFSLPALVQSDQAVTIGVSNGTFSNWTAPFTVEAAGIQAFVPQNLKIGLGATGSATINLTDPQATDQTITLTSTDPNVKVPSSVMVAAGDSSVTFHVDVATNATEGTATIRGSFNGSHADLSIEVTSGTIRSVTFDPSTVPAGTDATGTITLRSNASTDLTIDLALVNPDAPGTLDMTTVTIPAGSRTAQFTLSTESVGTTRKITVKATVHGTDASKTGVLTVVAAA